MHLCMALCVSMTVSIASNMDGLVMDDGVSITLDWGGVATSADDGNEQ